MGDADRLVSGEQGAYVAAIRAEQLHDPVVLDVGEAEAPILLRNLHAEGTELPQALKHMLGIFAGPIDLRGVDFVLEEGLELLVELAEFGTLVAGERVGMDEVEAEVAEEEFLDEARVLPLRLSSRLRDLAGFKLADVLAGVLRLRLCISHGSSCLSEGLLMNCFSLKIYHTRQHSPEGGQGSRTFRSIDFIDDSKDTRGTAVAFRRSPDLNSLRARADIFATTASVRLPRPSSIPVMAR